jgi:hypothetical protein
MGIMSLVSAASPVGVTFAAAVKPNAVPRNP